MPPSSLPRHLARAMNLRGIGVYDPSDPPDREFFTWLARKHQYRNVGFAPPLLEHPDVDVTGYQTFEPAECPVSGLDGLAERSDSAPAWVIGSLLAASAYIAPLFIHQPALERFEPFVLSKQRSAADLPEDQVMRHVRIAGYGMLDSFVDATASAYDAVLENEIEAERHDRAAEARADADERFWRLREEVSGDSWVGGYFDTLPAIEADRQAVDALETNADLMVGLGLVGGFAVNPPYD